VEAVRSGEGPIDVSLIKERLQRYFDKVAYKLGLPRLLIDYHYSTATYPEYKVKLDEFNDWVNSHNGIKVGLPEAMFLTTDAARPEGVSPSEWIRSLSELEHLNAYLVDGQFYVPPKVSYSICYFKATPLSIVDKEKFDAMAKSADIVYIDKVISAIDTGANVQIVCPFNPQIEPAQDASFRGFFFMNKKFFKGKKATTAVQRLASEQANMLYRAYDIEVEFSTRDTNRMTILAVPYESAKDFIKTLENHEPDETEEVKKIDPPAGAKQLPVDSYYEVVEGDNVGKIFITKFGWESIEQVCKANYYPYTYFWWIGGDYSQHSKYSQDQAEKSDKRAPGDRWLAQQMMKRENDGTFKLTIHNLKPGDRIYFRTDREDWMPDYSEKIKDELLYAQSSK
jgi:hypothetical protein